MGDILNAANGLLKTLLAAPLHTVGILVLFFVLVVGMLLLWGIAKRRGWVGEMGAVTKAIQDMSQVVVLTMTGVRETMEKVATGQIALTKILDRGYLSAEHTEVVRDYAFGRERDLRSALIEDLMTIYESYFSASNGKWCGEEAEVKAVIRKKIEAEVIRVDGRLGRIPSVMEHSLTSSEKQAHLYGLIDNLYRLISSERRKGEVRRIVSEMLTEVIISRRF